MASSSKSNVASFVVGIGASAGGLEALEEFFTALPADSGMAFVVVQHLNPDFKSLMDEILIRHTDMLIHKIDHGMVIEPNRIYLIPANKMMTLDHDRFELTERDDAEGLNLPIDRFFISLAKQRGESSIGIVLSGTGSDGTRGVREIHQAGGLVLAQTVNSSRFDGMPRSAVATGIVDAILVPSAMPRTLIDYADHGRPLTEDDEGEGEGEGEIVASGADVEPLHRIIKMLTQRFGVDFGLYKRGTISRRIERRMALHSALTIDDYANVVEEVPDELTSLYRDLLIGVTEFFRDHDAWEELNENVIPGICENANDREVRCWVAGTASGEEAYSLAMSCHEYLTANNIPLNIRIFATDLDTESLDFAGQGVYSSSSVARMSPQRLERYFSSVGPDRFQVKPEIRSMVVFAKQDLTNDPPFTNMDLVTCRNVIIYFDVEAQLNALSLFHFSLRVGGALFLGPSESLTELSHEFDIIDEKARLYTKRRDIRLPRRMMTDRLRPRVEPTRSSSGDSVPAPRRSGSRDVAMLRAYDTILDKYAPTSLLVDSFGQLAHTFNHGSDYLVANDGVASLDILDLIHPDLRMALSTGLQRARREASSVRYGGIRVHVAADDVRIVRVMIDTLDERTPADYYLVTLEEAHRTVANAETGQAAPSSTGEILPFEAAPLENDSAYSDHVSHLEQELRYAKEYLQTTNEELETSNEELQATNEELMASNEELQSTNEELRSVNEELYSVNKEYELKIDELTVMTDDMNNLLVSTDIGTVFLDDELCIRRFTPAVGRHFSLMHHDIGRPIAHINTNFSFPGLLRELSDVLNSGDHREYEVQDESDNWFLMTLLPYRLKSGKVDGVVLSFVDITSVRRTAAQLARASQEMQGFSYAVSHELLAPLRDITNSGTLLEEDHLDDIAASGREYLTTISNRADRIREMIGGLLQFSRVMTRGQPFAEVDFYDVVSDARAAVKPLIGKSSATIDTRLLPNVLWADREQLVLLVSEILTNAIRYSGRSAPEVTLNADLNEDQWRINFIDKGPGITGRDRERIFDMFARGMDVDDPVEGFGIGLAVARRIAERHGGWLSCEPHTDGAKFVFTVPVSVQEAE